MLRRLGFSFLGTVVVTALCLVILSLASFNGSFEWINYQSVVLAGLFFWTFILLFINLDIAQRFYSWSTLERILAPVGFLSSAIGTMVTGMSFMLLNGFVESSGASVSDRKLFFVTTAFFGAVALLINVANFLRLCFFDTAEDSLVFLDGELMPPGYKTTFWYRIPKVKYVNKKFNEVFNIPGAQSKFQVPVRFSDKDWKWIVRLPMVVSVEILTLTEPGPIKSAGEKWEDFEEAFFDAAKSFAFEVMREFTFEDLFTAKLDGRNRYNVVEIKGFKLKLAVKKIETPWPNQTFELEPNSCPA